MSNKHAIRGQRLTAAGVSSTGAIAAIDGPTLTEGIKRIVQEQTLSPAAIETPLTTVIPKGSEIVAVLGNVESALTGGGTTATWSLGTAADPDKYGTAGFPTQADSLAKNSKSNWMAGEDRARLAADETVVLTGCAAGGAADGDTALTNGSVRVVVIYDTWAPLADA